MFKLGVLLTILTGISAGLTAGFYFLSVWTQTAADVPHYNPNSYNPVYPVDISSKFCSTGAEFLGITAVLGFLAFIVLATVYQRGPNR